MTDPERAKMRGVRACDKCYEAHKLEGRKEKGLAPGVALHSMAVMWAGRCDDCLTVLVEAARAELEKKLDFYQAIVKRAKFPGLPEPQPNIVDFIQARENAARAGAVEEALDKAADYVESYISGENTEDDDLFQNIADKLRALLPPPSQPATEKRVQKTDGSCGDPKCGCSKPPPAVKREGGFPMTTDPLVEPKP